MAQIDPDPTYDHRLAEWATYYLQTGDPSYFPFARHFDADQRRAFKHALRVGLADLQETVAARARRQRLVSSSATRPAQHRAGVGGGGGNWPRSADPQNPDGLVNLMIERQKL